MNFPDLNEIAPRHLMNNWPMVQRNGERILGPSPQWQGPPPPRGSEVFIGKLPRDCFEDELFPILKSMGPLYCVRLMMDFSGHNRGFAFAIYATPDDAVKATALLNRYPVRPNCRVGASISVDNRRLFLKGLESGTKPDKLAEILQISGVFGLTLIEVHPKPNKSFALIEFESHTAASQARRILVPDCSNIFNRNVTVEWADPKFPSQDELKMRKALYIKNITKAITAHGVVQAIGNIIHPIEVQRFSVNEGTALIEFFEHEHAKIAMAKLKKSAIGGAALCVNWAKSRNGYISQRKQNTLQNITNFSDQYSM